MVTSVMSKLFYRSGSSSESLQHVIKIKHIRTQSNATFYCISGYQFRSQTTIIRPMLFIHSLVFSLEGRAWQEPEPSHVTGMALAHCILGKFLGVVCHCFPPPLDVPTLAARCLCPQRRERSYQRKVEMWAWKMPGSNFAWIPTST